MTKGEAIKRHCHWCRDAYGHGSRLVIERCPHSGCALWPFRPRLKSQHASRPRESAPC